MECEEADWFNDSENDVNTSEDESSENENADACIDAEKGKESQIKNRIASWATLNGIPDVNVNSLLLILRDAGLTYLPKDVRTLRENPKTTDIISCPPGEYFHYGLETALKDVMSKCKSNILNKENITIDINIDGLPICKSPQLSLWPILGRIVDKTCNEVFIIGIYRDQQNLNRHQTI